MEEKELLIIANGESVGCEAALARGRRVIALDGAADRLFDVMPDVILGDFDSITDPHRWGIETTFAGLVGGETPYRRRGVLIVPVLDQTRTDLQKGLVFCKGASSIWITNALGGRPDHVISNLGCLRQYPEAQVLTSNDLIRCLTDGVYALKGKEGSRCALFGFPKAVVTSHGLAYEMDRWELEIGGNESMSNRIRHAPASVRIEGSALLMEERTT